MESTGTQYSGCGGCCRKVLVFFAAVFAVCPIFVAMNMINKSSHMPVDFDLDMPQYMQKDNAYMIPKESIPTAGHERKTESTQEEAHTEGPPDEKMNIVLLYANDWTYKTLGAAGNTFVKTPNLDELAKQGIMFTYNCVTTAICWISRATLYTGQYASRHGGVMPESKGFFERWNETFYGQLAKNGYKQGFFGKFHHDAGLITPGTFADQECYYGSHWHGPNTTDDNHVTKVNERHAMNFLQKVKHNESFSLTVSFFATHAEDGNPLQYLPQKQSMTMYENDTVPIAPNANEASWERMPHFFTENNEGRKRWHWRYDTPEKYQTMMKNYYRMATEVDTACGNIIRELKRRGLDKNTLIIFTTDNGNYHAEHGLADKWYPHEESIRVPLIVFDPRLPKSEAGMKKDDFTLNIDLAPTMLKAAGIDPPKGMQGKDFSELYLKKGTKWRKEFYYEWPDPFNQITWIPEALALVRKDYKYLYWPRHNYEQLFDMVNDPLEENDLRNDTSKALVLLEMRTRFTKLREAVNSTEALAAVEILQ